MSDRERLDQLLSDLVRDAQRMADGEESAELDVDRGVAAIRELFDKTRRDG